jgi:hypothetical protein|tara:strand:+ start:781 stop:1314 length:534 start_codon:yes stop_codon:yes gene_type:complete
VFLGFDISTSIIGVTCVDKHGEIIFCEHCDLRKHKTLFEKIDVFRKFLADIRYLQTVVREIWIEEPFVFFNSGGSSGKTMAILQRFNGMASVAIRDAFHMDPQYVGATQARKLNEIKIPRGTKAKEEVLKFLLDKMPAFKVEYTKHGNPKPGYYDRADSVVIARAGHTLWKNKNSSF